MFESQGWTICTGQRHLPLRGYQPEFPSVPPHSTPSGDDRHRLPPWREGKRREGRRGWAVDLRRTDWPGTGCGLWKLGLGLESSGQSDVSGRSIPEKPSGPTEEVLASPRVTPQELGVEERQNPSKGRRRTGTCERKRGRPGLGNLLKGPWGL